MNSLEIDLDTLSAGRAFSRVLLDPAHDGDENLQPQYWSQGGLDRGGGSASNGKTSLTIEQAGAQITRDSSGWGGGGHALGTPATVSYAFRANAPVTMPDDTTGFVRFNATQITVSELSLAAWSDVANITFVRTGSGTSGEGAYSDQASILFGNYSDGAKGAAAFAYYPGNTAASSVAGDVWVNINNSGNNSPLIWEYSNQVLTHELGHAIGLSHPGDYNAGPDVTITYPDHAEYYEDSRQYSLMSYFASTNTGANLPGFAAAPQLDDIAAAQRLYGANMTTRTGDTVYGFNSTAGKPWYVATPTVVPVFAVWDAGGTDTLDFSGYGANQVIDLREGAFSNVGGYRYNVAIAKGAVIENAVGGTGADTLIGNDIGNALIGSLGNDTLIGKGGADAMVGGAGDDVYEVTDAGDYVQEAANEGVDTVVSYVAAYTMNDNVENLVFAGSMTLGSGNASANALFGNALNNVLIGGGGNDVLIGYAGNDIYEVTEAGDQVRENAGEGVDTVYSYVDGYGLTANVENLILGGSALIGFGNGLANSISGNAGNNTLVGGGGADLLIGGAGDDTYEVADAGDFVQESGFQGTDVVFSYLDGYVLNDNVENLVLVGGAVTGFGNAGVNAVIGNALGNNLGGGGGDDLLIGSGGSDTFFWTGTTAGRDTITDFAVADEKVVVSTSMFGNFAVVLNNAAQVGADTVITYDAGNFLTLKNVAKGDLTAGNFVFSGSEPGGDDQPQMAMSGTGEASHDVAPLADTADWAWFSQDLASTSHFSDWGVLP